MAEKKPDNNDIVPMGKAIAIIISVVLGVVVLVGGGVFAVMSLNKTNMSVANSSIGNTVQEGIVGTWEYTSKSSSSSFTSMYGYNFKKDGSYIWTNVAGDTFMDEVATHTLKESGTYSVFGNTVSLKNEETGETSKIKVKIISDKEISINAGE